MKYSVWSKRNDSYSSETKQAEFNSVDDATRFAELLFKGNSGNLHVWVNGVVKDYPVNEG